MKPTILAILLGIPLIGLGDDRETSSDTKPPFVYGVEHSGAGLPLPPLPDFDDLPNIEPLTDPFMWSDGSGRVTEFADWKRRRAEIKAELEHYEIGRKPDRPDEITTSYADKQLTVNVTVKGETLTLTSRITLPEGDGPFPAVIGIGFGGMPGSLPPDILSRRKIAVVSYNFGQVMAHQQKRGTEPINKLYPELDHIGAYAAWSWGVSRLIDGLELVKDDLPIDLKHLAVTGCSFAGKMALFAGAFDERIALTIAQEPGGGGAAAWRVSETLGKVEKLGSTSKAWFMEDMFKFSGSNVSKLPHDHHELMAMVAPRALLVLGNPDFRWLAEESGFVSCMAAREVWKAFGIEDRMGFSIIPDHGHCQLPDIQRPEVEAFIDKFLLGKSEVETNYTVSPYETVDHKRWIAWWGKGKASFPPRAKEGIETITFEAETATVGSLWQIAKDVQASNGAYTEARPGAESIEEAPGEKEGLIQMPFSLKKDGNYTVFARLNCPSADDDSFWIKVDDGNFERFNGLETSTWSWVKLETFALKAGEHTLTIGLREDGAKLDKISISNEPFRPQGIGERAVNLNRERHQEP